MQLSRRQFLYGTLGLYSAAFLRHHSDLQFGLVTYQWGRDWDIETLIANCTFAGAMGVELRTQHAHGVEPSLTKTQRIEIRERFEDSAVSLVGLGTNWSFHYSDPSRLAKNIEGAKDAIILSQDVGGSGVKVKPDGLPDGVAQEKTIEQIGRSLRSLARFGADYGQEIRLEVHGQGTESLPIIRSIMQRADHPGCRVCWNSNDQDMRGAGLKRNFELVRPWLGQTVHVREFDVGGYDYPQLTELLVSAGYNGWVLMEARTEPDNRAEALLNQRLIFDNLVSRAIDQHVGN